MECIQRASWLTRICGAVAGKLSSGPASCSLTQSFYGQAAYGRPLPLKSVAATLGTSKLALQHQIMCRMQRKYKLSRKHILRP